MPWELKGGEELQGFSRPKFSEERTVLMRESIRKFGFLGGKEWPVMRRGVGTEEIRIHSALTIVRGQNTQQPRELVLPWIRSHLMVAKATSYPWRKVPVWPGGRCSDKSIFGKGL